jgi:hypothetical protein
MRQTRYLRTDEHEEAVRSLEWAEAQARSLGEDSYQWKWVLISLHNAVQGFMVLALWQGNGLLALRDKIAGKWLKAYRDGGDYPAEKLDEFLNLYQKVKDKDNFRYVGAISFIPGETHDDSLARLNSYRNMFIHFTPKGWSLGLGGLPHICLDALDIIQFCGWETAAVLWHKKAHVVRAKRAHRQLRISMESINRQYAI